MDFHEFDPFLRVVGSDLFQALFGAVLSGYGAIKLVGFLTRIQSFNEIEFDKSYVATARLFSAVNNSVFLFGALLTVESFIKLTVLVQPLATFAVAYRPLAIFLSVLILWLIGWAHAQLFLGRERQHLGDDVSQRYLLLHREYSRRGVHELELLALPFASLATTALPLALNGVGGLKP